MIYIKNRDEIERIRESNQIVAQTLLHIKGFIEPGITTGELNREIEDYIQKKKGKPAFKGLYGFPASSCISVQDEVVHGIPSFKRKLKGGEIVGIDIGVELAGFFGDAACTFKVGSVDQKTADLLRVTEESLYLGIDQLHTDRHVGDIGHAIQSHVEKNHFSVVRDLVGHGVGRKPHEDPQVPNYGHPDKGIRLRTGMVLAIEPMVNMGTHEVYFADDEWTVKTKDGSPSAHFEHSVAIADNGPDILSKLDLE
jgi:methionyl aminopeptidase